MPKYQLSQQLCYSFYHINKLFNQFYIQNLKTFDLTYTQYLVLVTLWEESPKTVTSLGQKLDLASNTLTPLLKRLESKNYITRDRSERDKRQLYINLTPEGNQLKYDLEAHLSLCFKDIQELTPDFSKELLLNNQKLIEQLQHHLDK